MDIRFEREIRGLTLEEVASSVSIETSELRAWERGRKNPTREQAKALRRVFSRRRREIPERMAEIQRRRKLRGWTYEVLACMSGIGKSTISKFERGNRVPTEEQYQAMERAFLERRIDFYTSKPLITSNLLRQRCFEMGLTLDGLNVLFCCDKQRISDAIEFPKLRTIEMADRFSWLFGFASTAMTMPNSLHEDETKVFGFGKVRDFETFRNWQHALLTNINYIWEHSSAKEWKERLPSLLWEAESIYNHLQPFSRASLKLASVVPRRQFVKGKRYTFLLKYLLSNFEDEREEITLVFREKVKGAGYVEHYLFEEPEGHTIRSFTQFQLLDYEVATE